MNTIRFTLFLFVTMFFAISFCGETTQIPAALEPLGAKLGNHWAFKGSVLSFKAAQPLTEEQWKALEGLNVKSVALNGQGLDDSALARLAKMPLENLYLDGTLITDAGLTPLKDMRSLKSLSLSHAMKLTGSGAAALENHPSLTSVSIGGTAFGDAGMPALASIKQLTRLQLNHDRMTDAGIAALANHPALESFMISPQMTPRITEASLASLATIKTLKTLEIDETVLTYAGGLNQLKQLPNLKMLTLNNVGLSDADAAQFRKDLPNVELKFTPAKPENMAKWQAEYEKKKNAPAGK